jgi:hypothetical protein
MLTKAGGNSSRRILRASVANHCTQNQEQRCLFHWFQFLLVETRRAGCFLRFSRHAISLFEIPNRQEAKWILLRIPNANTAAACNLKLVCSNEGCSPALKQSFEALVAPIWEIRCLWESVNSASIARDFALRAQR